MSVNAEQLAEWLEQHLASSIRATNLDAARVQVSHILNWGGFVNHSFTINDGSARYHLKITNDPDCLRGLQRWHALHRTLEQRYRAPSFIDWIDLPQIGFAGLLLQHVDCTAADFCRNPDLLKEVIELADCLHQDAEIRSHLDVSDLKKTYFDYFVETYIDRFSADLQSIAADQPSFVSSSLFAWMEDETRRLREKADSTEAFHAPAIEPVHGDLHEGNILVTPTDWFLVDWDDLSLGDPAIEFAVLIWPLAYQRKDWQPFLNCAVDGAFAERLKVCLRAELLDEVIDNLADYVEGRSVPSRQAEIQLVKKRRHEEALTRYLAAPNP